MNLTKVSNNLKIYFSSGKTRSLLNKLKPSCHVVIKCYAVQSK